MSIRTRTLSQSSAKCRLVLISLGLFLAALLVTETSAFCPSPRVASGSRSWTLLATEGDNEPLAEPTTTTSEESSTPPPVANSEGGSVSPPPEENTEEPDDESPLMAVGRALKPLNDAINLVLRSNISTPFLILLPALCNPKFRAAVSAWWESTTQ